MLPAPGTAEDEENDSSELVQGRGRGRSESFVNELEDAEIRERENVLMERVQGNDPVCNNSAGANARYALGSYDSMDNINIEPVVKTQLSQKTLDIVTNLEHTKFNNPKMKPGNVELFPQPVVGLSAEEEAEEHALEAEEKVSGTIKRNSLKKEGGNASATKTGAKKTQQQVNSNYSQSKNTPNDSSGQQAQSTGVKPTAKSSKSAKTTLNSLRNFYPSYMRKREEKKNPGDTTVPTTDTGGSSGPEGGGTGGRTSIGESVGEGSNPHEEYDYHVKVLLLGDSGVGKTSLMLRFADNQFQPNLMSTAGVDFKVRYLEKAEKRIKCQIWDTAGQERFHIITRTYYKGSHGIALVYDVTNEQSFEQINYWMNNIQNHAGGEVFVVLFGNKVDLAHRKITYEQGLAAAQKYNALFYETSAKDGTNVLEAFEALSVNAVEKIEANKPNVANANPKRSGINMDSKKGKCSIL